MGHPAIKNSTGFAHELMFGMDESGSVVAVPLIQAAYAMAPDRLTLAPQQKPINLAGELAVPEPGASWRHEPQIAFIKTSTDVVMVGHAHAGASPKQSVDVGLKVGPVQKVVRVFGDRYWLKTGGRVSASSPQPFTKVPLVYERAFGGWDKAHKDEPKWTYDRRNPVGRGFGDPLRYVEEGRVPMPNIEDPTHLIRSYGDSPAPAGFGFISANWQPRVKFAGTYDETWDKERKPLLPKDFDRRFFNAASPGLIAPSYFKGDEDVVVVNAAPVTPLKFRLPGVPSPVCRVALRGGKTEVLRTNLDTVIVDTDEMLLLLVWRAYMPLPNGPHDVKALEIAAGAELKRPAVA